MKPRMAYGKAAPDVFKAMYEFHTKAEAVIGLAKSLLNLVHLRASQINGCAYCIDMHAKDMRAEGESEQRVYMLDAWRDASIYSARERAALAWTEAVTRLDHHQVPDAVYDEAMAEFSEAELARLTLAIVEINGWNRFNVAFRTPAGDYKAPARPAAAAG